MGIHIYHIARGLDEREITIEEEVKSVSNETTFSRDIEDIEVIRNTIFALAEKVCGRLRRAGLSGRTIHLKIRFDNFQTFTRLTHEVYDTAEKLLSEFDPLKLPVRLVGVGVSNLVSEKNKQLSIWDIENQRKLKLEKIMDHIQDKYGKHSITHAQTLAAKKKLK